MPVAVGRLVFYWTKKIGQNRFEALHESQTMKIFEVIFLGKFLEMINANMLRLLSGFLVVSGLQREKSTHRAKKCISFLFDKHETFE